MRYGTSIGDVKEQARFDKGDIIEDSTGRAVVIEVLVSITHLEVKYRVEWEETEKRVTFPERGIDSIEKVGEMERPHTFREYPTY